MKRSLNIMVLSIVALLMGSCTAMMNSSLYGSSDLYRSDNRIQVANELKAKAEAEKAEAEARQAMWEARIAEANASNAEAQYYASTTPSYSSIVADDYESAYARRLYGFSSPTYQLPSSYYSYSAYDAMRYATAYDPAYYNIMISGNQVWVEPRYITSMFGSWGATNVTFGIYSSPWNFGWSVHVDPFYYTWWGYPRYSWYDWNWNICYNPYHYWGPTCYPYYSGYYPNYYPSYYPGYHPGHRPGHNRPPQPPRPPKPDYRPDYRPGGGNGGSNGGSYRPNDDRRNSAPRYTSPTTNKNYGGGIRSSETTTGRRPQSGAVSTGINTSKTYRPATGTNTANKVQSSGSSNSGTRINNTVNKSTNKGTTTNTQRSSNYRQSTSSSSSSSYRSSSSTSNRSSSSSYSGSSSRSSSSSYSGSSSSSSSRSGGTTSSRR